MEVDLVVISNFRVESRIFCVREDKCGFGGPGTTAGSKLSDHYRTAFPGE